MVRQGLRQRHQGNRMNVAGSHTSFEGFRKKRYCSLRVHKEGHCFLYFHTKELRMSRTPSVPVLGRKPCQDAVLAPGLAVLKSVYNNQYVPHIPRY